MYLSEPKMCQVANCGNGAKLTTALLRHGNIVILEKNIQEFVRLVDESTHDTDHCAPLKAAG